MFLGATVLSACTPQSTDKDLKALCGSTETYAGVSELLFDRVRERFDGDIKHVNDLEKSLRLTVSQPVATQVLADIGRVDCEGRATFVVPSPLFATFGNREEITADIGYSIQDAADGKGKKFQLGGDEPLIVEIIAAAVAQSTPKSIQQAATVPNQPSKNTVTSEPSDRSGAISYDDGYATVTSFYTSLRQGDGFAANSLIAPEKRKNPNYQAQALSKFYGSMSEPLELVSVKQLNSAEFVVDYYWRMDSKVCNGRSGVSLTSVKGRVYIENIRTINGC